MYTDELIAAQQETEFLVIAREFNVALQDCICLTKDIEEKTVLLKNAKEAKKQAGYKLNALINPAQAENILCQHTTP